MSVDPPDHHQKVTKLPGQPNWSFVIPKHLNTTNTLQKPSIATGGLPFNMASTSTTSSTPSTPRKRTRSFTMETIPTLPTISGDMMLEVFTHSSLLFPRGPMNEDYIDNERLSILGAKVIEAAVTYTLFCKKPMLTARQLKDELTEALSDVNVDHWLSVYRLREKVRCTPNVVSELKSPEEGRLLFSSYVGAVFAQNGMTIVQDWVGKLIEPPPPVQAHSPDNNGIAKRIKNEPATIAIPSPSAASPAFLMHQAHYNLNPPSYMVSTPPPPPPTHPPPPLPNGVAPQTHPIAYLPLFNQTANQRRLGVEYSAQFFGPPHAGRWTVKCMVNGIEKGQGTGSSKQLAKEEAAKQAFYALGWASA